MMIKYNIIQMHCHDETCLSFFERLLTKACCWKLKCGGNKIFIRDANNIEILGVWNCRKKKCTNFNQLLICSFQCFSALFSLVSPILFALLFHLYVLIVGFSYGAKELRKSQWISILGCCQLCLWIKFLCTF